MDIPIGFNYWDPTDAGLNTDPDPGNYSTGREDQKNADPEQEDEREEKAEEEEKKKKAESDSNPSDIHTREPNKIDPVRSDPMHQFPKE